MVKLQEEFGPPIAHRILTEVGLPEASVAEACAVIGAHHSRQACPGRNFPIIWDADMIVNLSDEMADVDPEKLTSIIEKSFKTRTGKGAGKAGTSGLQIKADNRSERKSAGQPLNRQSFPNPLRL